MSKYNYNLMMHVLEKNDISEVDVDDVNDYGGITFDNAETKGLLTGSAQEKIVQNISYLTIKH